MAKDHTIAATQGNAMGKFVLISKESAYPGASGGEQDHRRNETRAMLPRAVLPLPSEEPRLGFVAVVDPLALRRDCISRVVQNWITPSQVIPVSAASELEELRGNYGDSIKMVLMNIGSFGSSEEVVARNVAWLHANLPDVPIVVLGDEEDADGIALLMSMGIRGFVPSSSEPRVARCALELVEAGGSFAPAATLLDRLRTLRDTGAKHHMAGSDDKPRCLGPVETGEHGTLSDRQAEVMQLIARGLPNKAIARKLGMCESTVKVHVRQILRKLGAKNRTEVALISLKSANDVPN